jgi:hypothetical protein
MSLQRIILMSLLPVALAACASSAERLRMEQEELAIYGKHAGEPVNQIRSFRFISWQPIADRSLLLEARLNEWYLIDVAGPCMGLPFANTIGFKYTMNTLQARFDSVVVPGESIPCRIERIRPVDAKAAKQELKALRAQG